MNFYDTCLGAKLRHRYPIPSKLLICKLIAKMLTIDHR